MNNKDIALTIYNYGMDAFFGKNPKDVVYRLNYGHQNTEKMFLEWIWNTFIENDYQPSFCARNPEDSYRDSFY